MPIYGACMIWKKSQIHLPFLLFVNICTNERAGRIQVMTYVTFSKAGILFWKKLIYFLICIHGDFDEKKWFVWICFIYHLFRKCTFANQKSYRIKQFSFEPNTWFHPSFGWPKFFSSIHLCPSNGIQIWSPSVIQCLFGIEVH